MDVWVVAHNSLETTETTTALSEGPPLSWAGVRPKASLPVSLPSAGPKAEGGGRGAEKRHRYREEPSSLLSSPPLSPLEGGASGRITTEA